MLCICKDSPTTHIWKVSLMVQPQTIPFEEILGTDTLCNNEQAGPGPFKCLPPT